MRALAEDCRANLDLCSSPNMSTKERIRLWLQCEHFIAQSVLSMGYDTMESLFAEYYEGDAQLWAVYDNDELVSCTITSMAEYATGKVLWVRYMIGSALKDWLHFEASIRDYARELGCTKLKAYCRKGLQRMLPEWDIAHIVMERKL